MENKLFFNKKLRKAMEKNCENTIEFLVGENIDFFITVEKDVVEYNPNLPSNILPDNNDFVIFHVINYGLENIHFENNNVVVEMGFGSENFGSTLTIPLWSIFQINIGNHIQKEPMFINILGIKATSIKENIKLKNGVDKSKNIFMNNPANKDLID